MDSRLERYARGECASVWEEISTGAASDEIASEIAEDFARRAYRNLERLHRRLLGIGYAFLSSCPLRAPSASDRLALHVLQNTSGPVPTVVEAWFRHVGSVDFSQHADQMYEEGPLAGLGWSGAMIVLGLPEAEVMHRELRAEGYDDPPRWDQRQQPFRMFLPTGGWGSNDEAMGIHLPDKRFDPPIINEGAGPMSFATMVRGWLQSGGFPFWVQLLKHPRRTAARYPVVPDFARLHRLLTEGLEPL